MSIKTSFSERLNQSLTTSTRGVLGLVDELLTASADQGVRLSWHAGQCQVSILTAKLPEQFQVPVPKSVFRAALARIAAMCNERDPNSVSPYGGAGELTVDADPPLVIRVQFVNTPEVQSLELASVWFETVHQNGVPIGN